MQANTDQSSDPALRRIAAQKLDHLRRDLLDLTRNNALVNCKITSDQYLRVIDEQPRFIFERLVNDKPMTFQSLPEPPSTPQDEQTAEFRSAVEAAKKSDRQYQQDVQAWYPSSRKTPPLRRLQDRVRKQLGMAERLGPNTKDANRLKEWARDNRIQPDFELPAPNDQTDQPHHIDNEIQTLAMPANMLKLLRKIQSNDRSQRQEIGVNSLYCAFGFLEWTDPDKQETSLSPLLLLPVELTRKNRVSGPKYTVTAESDEAEPNLVLQEKLQREFGIQLPPNYGDDIEQYFTDVSRALPRRINPRIRRYVTLGIFRSSPMALYKDLDPENWKLTSGPGFDLLVTSNDSLYGNNVATAGSMDAVERNEPSLVADADSSQITAVNDILDHKSFAIEGPPGSGKSQTIVNAIAAALQRGKKVLFVAQKGAALDVVKTRLQERGLGNTVLALQATQQERQAFRDQLNQRIDQGRDTLSRPSGKARSQYRERRHKIRSRSEALLEKVESTDMSVQEILALSIKYSADFAVAADDLPEPAFDRECDSGQIFEIHELADSLDQVMLSLDHKSAWAAVKSPPLDRFAVDDLIRQADQMREAYSHCADSQVELIGLGIDSRISGGKAVWSIPDELRAVKTAASYADITLVTYVISAALTEEFSEFVAEVRCTTRELRSVKKSITTTPSSALCESLQKGADDASKLELENFSIDAVRCLRRRHTAEKHSADAAAEPISILLGDEPWLSEINFPTLRDATELLQGADARSILRLRNEENTAEGGESALRKAMDRIRKLRERRVQLSTVFMLRDDLDTAGIAEASQILYGTGAFGKLLGSYRRAKKQFRHLAVEDARFEANEAAKQMEELASWQKDVTDLENNETLRSLFGIHFDGIDTPLDDFEQLADFIADVSHKLGNLQSRRLRRFLLNGDIDQVMTVVEFPELPNIAVAELDEHRTYLDDRLSLWEASIDDIEFASSVLQHPEQFGAEALANLATEMTNALKRRDQCENHRLNEKIDSLRFESDAFKGELDLLDRIERCSVPSIVVSRLVGEKKLGQTLSLFDQLRSHRDIAERILDELRENVSLRAATSKDFATMTDLADQLAHDRQGLIDHSRAHSTLEQVREAGFGPITDWLNEQRDTHPRPGNLILAHLYLSLARRVRNQMPRQLAAMSTDELERQRQKLVTANQRALDESADDLFAKLVREAKPPQGIGRGRKRDYTEMALVNHTRKLKKNTTPIRELTRRASQALVELQPCWMMSPLAVATYLQGDSTFDLCIIDEASQMPPESAMGAILRSNQVVVVGDSNQLPPTKFGQSISAEDEDEESDQAESILELATKTFQHSRRLKWHYRSRDSSLISFSNRYVYDSDLVVFPSPMEMAGDKGVSLRTVDGIYNKSVNAREAEAVVEAAVDFMRRNPERSLGIVTLNAKQCEVIHERLEEEINNDRTLSKLVQQKEQDDGGIDSLFVKNLENVQGDERDAIFISTVYGPSEQGRRVSQQFGPHINGRAGYRRLNVLLTRAREKIVTFTSMSPADIVADPTNNRGRYLLKQWLAYSAEQASRSSERIESAPRSPMVEHVAQLLRDRGWDVDVNVGSDQYGIDIGVRHRVRLGYFCGIDVDDYDFHASPSIRDRDILRRRVLEGLGWKLYQVWSTNWFTDEDTELTSLLNWVDKQYAEADDERFDEPDVVDYDSDVAEGSDDGDATVDPTDSSEDQDDSEDLAQRSDSPSIARPRVGDSVILRGVEDSELVYYRRLVDSHNPDNHLQFSVHWDPGATIVTMRVGEERRVRIDGSKVLVELRRIQPH
ncbi:DUF4011 domain-containing protein [Haloglycomyces albus]|uniref:DUF4011 domain-containing protein n=1 Tax=Haloglycomyces albus TaxID=526067 RepID=UPI00046D67FB|nr:DUF4011 domain-containing protein [Haloglycomyces albus]